MINNEICLQFNVNIHDVLIKREFEYNEVMAVMMIIACVCIITEQTGNEFLRAKNNVKLEIKIIE
jgi:hypothetical protein